MGQARDSMDELTEAFFSKDWETGARLYAPDAVAVTPDRGEVTGNDNIAAWSKEFIDAFPNARYEPVNEYESGNTAIDKATLWLGILDPYRTPRGKPFLPPPNPCGYAPAISRQSKMGSSPATGSTTTRWIFSVSSG